MIGLGSNRLTIARRGGMSVTQAGRGGMEWLAGGRWPRWSSPYSAQATAALKDAFTAAQWQTIKAYGFAHPEIVGYMNAYAPEDAKIAYGLVPTLGIIRALYNTNTNNYFDLGIVPDSNTSFELEFKYANTAYLAALGGVRGTSNSKAVSNFYMAATGAKQMTISVGDGYHSSGYTSSYLKTIQTEYNVVKISGNGIWVNGHQTESFTATVTTTNNIRLFRHFPTGNDGKLVTYISKAVVEKGGVTHIFVPFVRNNMEELLDLATGQLATRVGSFTISETPAS